MRKNFGPTILHMKKKFGPVKIPTWKNFWPTNTSKKNLGPQENVLDPRNNHEKTFWTKEMPTKRNFRPKQVRWYDRPKRPTRDIFLLKKNNGFFSWQNVYCLQCLQSSSFEDLFTETNRIHYRNRLSQSKI